MNSKYFQFSKDPLNLQDSLSPSERLQIAKETFIDCFEKTENESGEIITAHELNLFIDSIFNLHAESISYAISKLSPDQVMKTYKNEKVIADCPTPDLLTPYFRFYKIFSFLKPKPRQTVIDIGSGFGRLGFYLATVFPEVQFVGFEIFKERVEESQRVATALKLSSNTSFVHTDVSKAEFFMPRADYYYLYDSLSQESREKLMRELNAHRKEQAFSIAMSGLPLFNYLSAVKWLKLTLKDEKYGYAIFQTTEAGS